MYLYIRLFLCSGGQIAKTIGPFASDEDMARWSRKLNSVIGKKKKKIKKSEITLLEEKADESLPARLTPAQFLRHVFGEYQDVMVESNCLLHYGGWRYF